MASDLVLASGSEIRLQMLTAAGLDVTARPVRVDEDSHRISLQAEGASPRDVADALAEIKARRASHLSDEIPVLGCDQILAFDGTIFAKPETPAQARDHLLALRGKTHHLFSAAVLYQAGIPVWRHVGHARLTMRDFSDSFLDSYLARNWPALASSVGGYKIEEEGIRLFDRIEGDHFTILGLPLLPLLSFLVTRGVLPK